MYNVLTVFAVVLPILLGVAFLTILERKVMGSIQRRVGPDTVGVLGVLQPFADALKLITKEQVIPTQSNKYIFMLSPVLSLFFSLIGWAVIPFGVGLSVYDFDLGLLYSLAFSSLGVFGVLLAGWSANNKYAFLGALRSSAQIISYELIFSACVLSVLFMAGSFNYNNIIFHQQATWYLYPILPIFMCFLISILAETNRTPFDLPEAESELVAGYITEKSATVFVFFFLAEYSSILLISTITSLLFIGGYNCPLFITNNLYLALGPIILGIKTCIICIFFVWARATLPRMRFDKLIAFCWTSLLPFAIAFLLVIPCMVIAIDFSPFV